MHNSKLTHHDHAPEWGRIPAFDVPAEAKGAWTWALKSRQGWRLADLLAAGGDEMVRRLVRERISRGEKVPPWVAEYVQSLNDKR